MLKEKTRQPEGKTFSAEESNSGFITLIVVILVIVVFIVWGGLSLINPILQSITPTGYSTNWWWVLLIGYIIWRIAKKKGYGISTSRNMSEGVKTFLVWIAVASIGYFGYTWFKTYRTNDSGGTLEYNATNNMKAYKKYSFSQSSKDGMIHIQPTVDDTVILTFTRPGQARITLQIKVTKIPTGMNTEVLQNDNSAYGGDYEVYSDKDFTALVTH